MGAYVTTYPNVCLGLTGQWHHPITDTPPEKPEYLEGQAAADIGFAVSNDGVHFREPAPGFTFIARDQELQWDRNFRSNANDKLLLSQGPMINHGERTLIYYGAGTPTGNSMVGLFNIGLAVLPRDRFGYLTPVPEAPSGDVRSASATVTETPRLYLNIEIDHGGSVQVALTEDDGLAVLPGYEMTDSVALTDSGLREPVRWGEKKVLPQTPFCVRLRLNGPSRLFAAYLERGA